MTATKARNQTMSVHQLACQDADIAGSSWAGSMTCLLVGGDKGGADQRRFYKRLIAVADERFDGHLDTLKTSHKEPRHGKKT